MKAEAKAKEHERGKLLGHIAAYERKLKEMNRRERRHGMGRQMTETVAQMKRELAALPPPQRHKRARRS